MASLENNIGIFGGTFDPPHKGHLKISKLGIRSFKLKKLYWVITKKNPSKKRSYYDISLRIKKCNLLIKKNKRIKLVYLEEKLGTNRIYKSVRYLKKTNKGKLFFFIGSDNLLKFHKWVNFKEIIKLCTIVVFSRKGFDKKARKSNILKYLKKNNLIFANNKTIDISSSIIRKKILKNGR